MKPWYKSKTIWLNAAAAALVVVETNFHLLQGSVPPVIYVAAVGTLAFANVLLRAVTTTGITLKGAANAD